MDQVGRYQMLEELGRGAMGVVYKARDPAIGRTVAIKTIRLGDASDAGGQRRVREKLLREAHSAGMLNHPNIVTVHDVLEHGDVAYIVMEHVQGQSLEHLLQGQRLPDAAELLRILRQVAEALDYAHRKGVVHRDIKPANIILSDNAPGAERIAKITDFGVAKIASLEITQTEAMMGTPNYMSPEQIQGRTLDGRSDQFSLGVIAYELLCGEKPFGADSFSALLYQICTEDPRPVESLNPLLSETVGKVMQRVLAKEPNNRFDSCSNFIGALSIALGDCPDWRSSARPAAVPVATAIGASAGFEAGAVRPPAARPANGPTRIVFTTEPEISTIRAHAVGQEVSRARRSERSSTGKKIALLLALCLAIAGVIVFIVRMNSGPAVPVEVLDTSSGPVSPPPSTAATHQPKQTPEQLSQTPVTPLPALQKPALPTVLKTAPAPSSAQPPHEASSHATLAGPGMAAVELLTDPPGATIVVDGRANEKCTAPCTLSLPNGRHTLTARANGYAIARRIFTVPDDSSLIVPLAKSEGVLLVTSTPSGSTVIVDGKNYGTTPVTLHLSAGVHQLVIASGATQHSEAVVVEAGGFEVKSFRWR